MRRTRRELFPGAYVTCLQTDKFKTGLLSAHLLTRLDGQTASQNALIPRVLRRGTVSCPDMAALAARLDGLYGARIEPSVRKLGEMQALGFVADFVDEGALNGDGHVLEDVAALLGEMLLAPHTRGGLLLPGYVEGEKRRLIEDIRARVNDRAEYAHMRLLELMCPGEAYAVDALGTETAAEAIGYVTLTRHYRALLASSPMEIFYCGPAAPERVAAALGEALSALPRGELDEDIGTDIRLNTVEEQPRAFAEQMDVNQGKLALGFRLGEAFAGEPDMPALRVMNALLGDTGTAYVSSKLFRNVRERLSLCYYVYSGLDPIKGLLTVAAGIDPADYEKVLAEIDRQVQAVRSGEFTKEELATARMGVSADLLALTDDQAGLERFWLGQNLLGLDYGPEELAALAEDVTAAEVEKAAAGIACDAVYFLSGAGEDEDAKD